MKLDKIKFARLIGMITNIANRTLDSEEIETIDYVIDIEFPQPRTVYVNASDVNYLMFMMAAGTQKIEAIKLHRKLTGWGLKESKDEVEKYWPALSNHYVPPSQDFNKTAPGNLGDILAAATKG